MIISLRTGWAAGILIFAIASVGRADIIAQWHFDETPGSTIAADAIGGFDGTVSGAADFVAEGVVGNAISISKAGNGIVNMGPNFPFSAGDFSVVAWARTEPGDTTGDYFVCGTHRSGIVAGWFLGINANGPYGQTGKAWFYQSVTPGNEITSNTTVNDGKWHQLVIVYRAGATATYYVDGLPTDAQGAAHTIGLVNASFLIGGIELGNNPTSFFNGWVDEVQLYDHALRPCDIQQLFDDPQSTAPDLDPCPTDINDGGGTTVTDLLELLGNWGQSGVAADINCDLTVDVLDLLELLAGWGDCP